jgi:Domain of unknown function (DUF4037)
VKEILDETLTWFRSTVESDAEVIGCALYGSQVFGQSDSGFDYDILCVLTTNTTNIRPKTLQSPSGQQLEFWYVTSQEFIELSKNFGWWTFGLAHAQIILDKAGHVRAGLNAVAFMPENVATPKVAEDYDGYLNAFYRSLKAFHRHDEFGGRLHATDSVRYLIGALFALELRWTPYWDRIQTQWVHLERQGWSAEELSETCLELLRTGNPKTQQTLEAKVQNVLKSRGFEYVLEGWGTQLENVRSFKF